MEEESVINNGGCGGGGSGGARANMVQVMQRRFGEVQGILEQNRVLIQEISQNHEARDADGLTRNVALIREVHTNITHLVDLYANLSGSFSNSITTSNAASTNNTNTTSSSSPSATGSAKAGKQPGTIDTK
uniref:Protein EARLY FLOWERING 4 domain-containing protein n=1 Tax=Oryza punctata TaxID=4537 RepID=A0A0E0LU82_ORYPU